MVDASDGNDDRELQEVLAKIGEAHASAAMADPPHDGEDLNLDDAKAQGKGLETQVHEDWTPGLFRKHQTSTARIGGDEWFSIKYCELKGGNSATSNARDIPGVGIKPLPDGNLRSVTISLTSRFTGNVKHCAGLSEQDRRNMEYSLKICLKELYQYDPLKVKRIGKAANREAAGEVGRISHVTSFERSGDRKAAIQDRQFNWTSKGVVAGKDWPGVCVETCRIWAVSVANALRPWAGAELSEQRTERDPHVRNNIRLKLVKPTTQDNLMDSQCIRIIDESSTVDPRKWQNSKLTSVVEFVPYDTPSLAVTPLRIHRHDVETMYQARIDAAFRDCRELAQGSGLSCIPGDIRVQLFEKKRPLEEDADNGNERSSPKRLRMEGTARGVGNGGAVFSMSTQGNEPGRESRVHLQNPVTRPKSIPKEQPSISGLGPHLAGHTESYRPRTATVGTTSYAQTPAASTFSRLRQGGSSRAHGSSRGGPTSRGPQLSQGGSGWYGGVDYGPVPRYDRHPHGHLPPGQGSGHGVPTRDWETDRDGGDGNVRGNKRRGMKPGNQGGCKGGGK